MVLQWMKLDICAFDKDYTPFSFKHLFSFKMPNYYVI